jgi:hypothetical protein
MCTAIDQRLRNLRKSFVPPQIGHLPLAICHLRSQRSRTGSICGSLQLGYSQGRRGCPEIEHGCVNIGNCRLAARFPIIPTPGGGRGGTSTDVVPDLERRRPRHQGWNSRLARRLRTTRNPHWRALQTVEARGVAGKLATNRGPHSRFPSSARTTSRHESNRLAFASLVLARTGFQCPIPVGDRSCLTLLFAPPSRKGNRLRHGWGSRQQEGPRQDVGPSPGTRE